MVKSELAEINSTLKDIEKKIKDSNASQWSSLFDWNKTAEEKRDEEMIQLKKDQNSLLQKQLEIFKNQEDSNKVLRDATIVVAISAALGFLITIFMLGLQKSYVGWMAQVNAATLIFLAIPMIALTVILFKKLFPLLFSKKKK